MQTNASLRHIMRYRARFQADRRLPPDDMVPTAVATTTGVP
ncbi:hypothetical protein [Streptomyces sp. NPDC048295]